MKKTVLVYGVLGGVLIATLKMVPMPVGLIVALVTAGVLSRRKKNLIQENALT